MKIKGILINTCLNPIEVALIEGDDVIKLKSWEQSKSESSKLQLAVIELLGSENWDLKDLNKIYVVTGPGSFTAIRIGVIFAKTLALYLGIELGTLNTFDYMKGRAENSEEFVLNAGGNSVYLFRHENDFEIVDLSDVHNLKEQNTFRMLSEKQKLRYEVDNSKLENLEDIWGDMKDNFKILKGEAIENLEPNYVKAPNIT